MTDSGDLMNKLRTKYGSNKNGFLTLIWGEPAWETLFFIAADYPMSPTELDKENYKNFFLSLQNVLPCISCKMSYSKHMLNDNTKLKDSDLEDRYTLMKWLYDLKNVVNKSIGVEYLDTFEEVVDKYESARAVCDNSGYFDTKYGCSMSLERKAIAFKIFDNKNAPVIPIEIADKFIKIAKMRGIREEYFTYINYIKSRGYDIETAKKHSSWALRNQYCNNQRNRMRLNAKSPVELSGTYKNTPSISELKLILHLSSTLKKNQLDTMIENVALFEKIDK